MYTYSIDSALNLESAEEKGSGIYFCSQETGQNNNSASRCQREHSLWKTTLLACRTVFLLTFLHLKQAISIL